MLTQQGRITEAVLQLHQQKAKDIFLQLVAEHPNMSVFWDTEEGSATLEDREVNITIT